jgi:hypothetical protein
VAMRRWRLFEAGLGVGHGRESCILTAEPDAVV